jgi:hypothetical protein
LHSGIDFTRDSFNQLRSGFDELLSGMMIRHASLEIIRANDSVVFKDFGDFSFPFNNNIFILEKVNRDIITSTVLKYVNKFS